MLVLDACAAIFLFREDAEFSEGSRLSWLESTGEKVIAPDLFCVETVQVAWKYAHAHVCDTAQAGEMAKAAMSYVDGFVDSGSLIAESLSEAIRLDHPLYDMLYFVLARRNGAQLVTCDKRLARLCAENEVDCLMLLAS